MYLTVINRINQLSSNLDVPYDFLMEVAEKREEEVIGWLKWEANVFGYEYEEDGNYIADEVLETVNEEAYKYLGFLEEEYSDEIKK